MLVSHLTAVQHVLSKGSGSFFTSKLCLFSFGEYEWSNDRVRPETTVGLTGHRLLVTCKKWSFASLWEEVLLRDGVLFGPHGIFLDDSVRRARPGSLSGMWRVQRVSLCSFRSATLIQDYQFCFFNMELYQKDVSMEKSLNGTLDDLHASLLVTRVSYLVTRDIHNTHIHTPTHTGLGCF